MQYCSLQHQTLHPSPVTSTTGPCFCFGSASSFFLGLFLHSSSCILGTYQPREFIFQFLIFLPFHVVHGVLKARILKCFAIPFSAVATGLEKVSFHCNSKGKNTKECSNYYTVALISHTSKVMLKILQARLQ